MDEKTFELFGLDGFDRASMAFLQGSHDRCEIALQWIQRLIVESDAKQIVKIAPPILSRVFNELGNGIVNLNNARKITDFPIPFHLAQMITVMLITHTLTLPFIAAMVIDNIWSAGSITFFVSFAYWAVHFITIELEMPFGDDANDLPLRDMQTDFNMSLSNLIEDLAQTVPRFIFEPQKHLLLKTKSINFDRNLSEGAPARTRGSRFEQAARGRTVSEISVEDHASGRAKEEADAPVVPMPSIAEAEVPPRAKGFGGADELTIAAEGSAAAPTQKVKFVELSKEVASPTCKSITPILGSPEMDMDISVLESYLQSADITERVEGYLALAVQQLKRIATVQDTDVPTPLLDVSSRSHAWGCGGS